MDYKVNHVIINMIMMTLSELEYMVREERAGMRYRENMLSEIDFIKTELEEIIEEQEESEV